MLMKKTLILILLAGFFSGCSLFGEIKGSGNIVTQELELEGFNQVEAGNQFKVEITRAENFKVIMHLDDNLHKYLKTTISKGRLVVGMKGHHNFRVSKESMRVEISMPSLSGIDLSGAATGQIQGFKSDQPFKAYLSGAAYLNGDITAGQTDFDLSGASKVSLSGQASSLRLEGSGASDAKLKDFVVQGPADIGLSGASDADLTCHGELSFDGSGASNLSYRGTAKLAKTNTSGASSIKKL